MPAESDVIKGVKERLKLWEFHKVVVWFSRLNSGRVKTAYGTWVQMCDTGTPDYVAVIRCKDNNLFLIFAECKSETGIQREAQRDFQQRFTGIKNVYYCIINNPNQIDEIISNIGIDRLNELPENIG